MDLVQYFSSYKTSLLKDLPKGCNISYIETVPSTEGTFKSMKEYLNFLGDAIQPAAEAGYQQGFMTVLGRHQEAYIRLIEGFVEKQTKEDFDNNPENIFDIITQYGWKVFKFLKRPTFEILFKNLQPKEKVLFVPRYSGELRERWARHPLCMDADEASVFCSMKDADKEKLLRSKLDTKSPNKIRFDSSGLRLFPLSHYNSPSAVCDWTLPLEAP